MVFSKETLISYVEGLVLAPFDKEAATVAKVATNTLSGDTASVVGSLAVGFPKDLEPRLKADIQNSLLFAQLAADARYTKADPAQDWYNAYRDVLQQIGWVSHIFTLKDVKDADKHVSVDKLVLELAPDYLAPDDLKLLDHVVATLPKSVNTGAQKILDKCGGDNNIANFQVAIGGANDRNAFLKIGGYAYSIQSKIDHVLFTKFSDQSVKFQYVSQTIDLNDQVYSAIRQAIIDKLGDSATQLVADVTLG